MNAIDDDIIPSQTAEKYFLIIMKKIIILIALISALSWSGVLAQKSDRIIIVNGYFFNNLPSELKKQKPSEGTRVFSIETPDETVAVCLYSPSISLSQESLKDTVPVKDVKEGIELLRRYNEQKDGNGLSFKPGESKPKIKVGDRFPNFSAVDIDGKRWTNTDAEGKVMVLNLWFTGCRPCRKEMPELSVWKDEMPDVMFFSSTYESPEIARKVLDKVRFNWIPLVNDTQFKDWIGIKGYPLTIVVDKSGIIATFEYGTSPEQRAQLKSKIQSLR